uniref:DEAH (Asp-Glu-Ala-His) box polypeptide 32 n=1 Tax=Nothobranchius kadleci TaxID=1051664 RepID=A0A1A8CFJ1_NOTKA
MQRPDLRVVLLSAVAPGPKQLALFTGSALPVIHLETPDVGEVVYSSTGDNYFCAALRLVLEIHQSEELGDVIVFLNKNKLSHHSANQHGSKRVPQTAGGSNRQVFLSLPKRETASRRDCNEERWCQDLFLNHAALLVADALHSELTDTLKRIELPISAPAFGSRTNTINIKRALLAGFFMQVARDVDGSGNYFILTHKHVAQIHPLSAYGAKSPKLGLPEWVLFHEHTFSEDNCLRTLTHITPEEFVQMVPQYFFYNLPSSESKDILQSILNREASLCQKGKSHKEPPEDQTTDRCVVQ